MLNKTSYNPDVLTCLANLSNDEVFTPPQLVNQILDAFPKEIWQDKSLTFLDPACKTGVFLREIAKRLMVGLEAAIPDKKERAAHIFKNQLFGIAITELTALMSRRSVYCSKIANGKYSVCDKFKDAQGNIKFSRLEHTWDGGSCKYCGASKDVHKRGSELETHAYHFIHSDKPQELFNMKFDVIIGNPPYQLNDGGFGRSASPIYHNFVHQAKKLSPRYLTMIIPSRWFGGGKGLDGFRKEMLNDSQMRKIVDYIDASECFPGVDIAGGICYFLWEKGSKGPCEVLNMHNGVAQVSTRPLNEFNTFIRHGAAVPIIKKVLAKKEPNMGSQVTSRKPFGLDTLARPEKKGDIVLHWQKGEGPFDSKRITTGIDMIDKWKVITSYVGYDHAGQPDKEGKRRVLSRIDILPPGTICNETYIVIGSYTKEKQARNLISYMKTCFFRFLVSQFMYSHHITKDSYSFVPILDMDQEWTDAKLFSRYSLTKEESSFIQSVIRPMESNNE